MSDKEQLRKEFEEYISDLSFSQMSELSRDACFNFMCKKLSPLPVEKQQSEDELWREAEERTLIVCRSYVSEPTASILPYDIIHALKSKYTITKRS